MKVAKTLSKKERKAKPEEAFKSALAEFPEPSKVKPQAHMTVQDLVKLSESEIAMYDFYKVGFLEVLPASVVSQHRKFVNKWRYYNV